MLARRAGVRRILGFGAVLAGLAALLGFGVFPQGPARRLAEARLQEAAGAGSRIGGLRVIPFLLRAEVRDLHVEGASYELSAPVVRVVVHPRALTGALAVRSLEVDAPFLRLSPVDGDEAPAETAGGPLPSVEIGAVAIEDARLSWDDPTTGGLVLEGLTVKGAIGSGALSIEAPRGVWRGERELEIGPARARLAITRDLDAVLESLEARFGESKLTARGALARRGRIDLDVGLEAALDLDDGGRALDTQELSGALHVTGRVDGPIDRLRLTLDARGAGQWEDWPIDDVRLHLEAQPDVHRAEARLKGHLLGGTLQGEARIDGQTSFGHLRGLGLDLARLPVEVRPPVRVAGAQIELSWEGPLEGPLRVDLAAHGRGRLERATGYLETRARGSVQPREGTADLEWSARLRGESSAPVALDLQLETRGRLRGAWPPEVTGQLSGAVSPRGSAGEGELALAGTFTARGDEVRAQVNTEGLLDLSGELDVRGDRIRDLSLVGEEIDLATLVSGASGRARLDVRASGRWQSPDLSALVSAVGLGWHGVALGRLEAGAEGTTDRADLRAALPDLGIGAEGELSSGRERRLRGQVELHETDLARVSPLLGTTEPLEGHLTGTLAFDLPWARPAETAGTFDVADLEVVYEGRSLRAQPFRAELRDGRIALRDVQVEGAGVSLDLSASTGLREDEPVELRAWLEADLSVLPLPEEWSIGGSLSGAIGLTGTRVRPSLEGAFHAADVALSGPSVPAVGIDEMELHLGDGGLRIPPFDARVGAGEARLQGEVPYAAVWPALRDGRLSASDRARLSATWQDVVLDPFEGGLSGELTIEGGLALLDELEGELRLPASGLHFEGLALELQPATLHLAGGRVTTDGLTVRSARGDLVVTGGADLLAKSLDVRARGVLALGLLSPLLPQASIGGTAEVDIALSGPLVAPVPGGSVALQDVSVRMRDLPQAVSGIRGRIGVGAEVVTLAASGALGGGTLQLEGEARVPGGELGEFWLQLTGRDAALRYPPGLRSRLDVDLTLAGRPGDLVLAGNVGVQGGVYELDAALRDALRAPAAAAAASDVLRDVALDVTVDLARPIAVQSTFGRLEATGRINARGDLQEPAPFGRLDVRRGGVIELQGRDLTVTGGTIAYTGSWNGDLSLSGETIVPDVEFNDRSSRDVRVRASLGGSIQQPSLTLTSEPALSRQEIVSAIATGRLQSSLVDSSAWLLGGQAATLVSGQLTRRVAESFGLDEITVRPDLVARETDPSARFTFGKRIGRPLALVYSAGLGGPETRFAEMRAFPGFNVQLRAQRRDSGTHELGLGQRFGFGGEAPNEPIAESGVRLDEVRFEGAPLEEGLRRSVRLSTRKRVPDWRVQQEAERLRARLRRAGYLDAEVSARIEGSAAVVGVELGPAYNWRIEGMVDPPSLDRALAPALFEADAVDLGRDRLLSVLGERGYLEAEVEASTTDGDDRREIVFTVVPGPCFDPVTVEFPGAKVLSRRALLAAAGGASGLLATPEAAVAGLKEAYRARYLLAARIGPPQVERWGSAVRLTVPIEEGPPALLLWARAEGATLPEKELREALSLPIGEPFSTETVTEAVARVRTLYLSHGYTDVRVRPEIVVEGDDLGLSLRIREGERRVIERVTVSGNTRTRDWLIQRALDLEEGEPLDPRRLREAERRLSQLGTFSRSAVVPDPENPGSVRADVQEASHLSVAYDVRWDDESGWSGLVDGGVGNLFGLGVGLGGRVRYGADLREFRGSLHLPAALIAGDVTGSVFRTDEDIPADDFEIVRRQTGFQIQQSIGRPSRLEVLLGYRFRRNLTIAPTLPEIPIDVGGLDVSLLRTTQDDLLDPRRGAFLSLNVNVAPSWLGSDAPLLKGFAQSVLSHSFREETLTWAQSYRLGLAWGLDGEPVIEGERFKAGGASSLRGFGTNEVGPRGFFDEPVGGEAVVIMNQELRFHHRSGLGLVGFYDVGNVFPTVESIRVDFRHTLGAGLRWASPVGLLRLDVGFPVDRKPEEKSYRLFFGLGQAF